MPTAARIALAFLVATLLAAAPATASSGAAPAGQPLHTPPADVPALAQTAVLTHDRPVAAPASHPEVRGPGLPFTAIDLAFALGGAGVLLIAGLGLVYATRPPGSEPLRILVRRARAPEPVIARR